MAIAQNREKDFFSLSVKDLLEAREAYHIHLSNLDNVVGTAIGLYRMHYQDSNAKSADKDKRMKYGKTKARTLYNTVVKPWSWPCVLVFVKKWLEPEEFRSKPHQAVPRFLHLPDGRVIPTCVLCTPAAPADTRSIEFFNFPTSLVGGGFPCIKDSQGKQQVGTLGCLVSKAGSTFVLTNHHVAGDRREKIFTLIKGVREEIGRSSGDYISKMKFSDVYPDWPGHRTYLNLDAGMIRIDDLNQWSSQIFGMGEMGPLVEMHEKSISLDLIGKPVRVFGGQSGPTEGEIFGLFYRYKSVGGADYVTDILIGPKTDRFNRGYVPPKKRFSPSIRVGHGDSGSIVFIDDELEDDAQYKKPFRDTRKHARRFSPIAMLWGGQKLGGISDDISEPEMQFAFATFLSTICRILDLDIVNDWNLGFSEYWGKSAHFKIGYKFCELLSNATLKDLLENNRDLIGFPDSSIELGKQFSVGRGEFVPLADVPDYRWIFSSRTYEPMQHFADIDNDGDDDPNCLLNLCRNDPGTYLKAAEWKDYFSGFDYMEPGALPFRIRQIYEDMVQYLSNNDILRFTCALGVLAHYVADACNSLHISTLHHGYGPKVKKNTDEYKQYKNDKKYKIHSIFEQSMLEVRAVEIIHDMNNRLQNISVAPSFKGGANALKYIFDIMDNCYKILPPKEIIEYDDPDLNVPKRAALLYDNLGDKTVQCLMEGCIAIAALAESAWKEGKGDNLNFSSGIPEFSQEEVQDVCRDRNFLPALDFDGYIQRGF